MFSEKKREVYDLYGKEGVLSGGHKGDEEFSFNPSAFGGFHFHFRTPEEIFRDFFGTDDPFANFFGGKYTTTSGIVVFTYIMDLLKHTMTWVVGA